MVVMLMTGSIMKWYSPFSDSWRQGATFVHDWFAIGLLFAIIGHIVLAFRDPDALNGMMHGWVEGGLGEASPSPLVRGDGRLQTDGGGALDPVGDAGAGVLRATRPKSGCAQARCPSSIRWTVAPGMASASASCRSGRTRAVTGGAHDRGRNVDLIDPAARVVRADRVAGLHDRAPVVAAHLVGDPLRAGADGRTPQAGQRRAPPG